MKKEKVIGKTKEEFIREVALDCIAHLDDKFKDFLCDNPDCLYYHFGYAMFIRNHYIHNRDFSEAGFFAEPDSLSSEIMDCIFSLLIPDEYRLDDAFTDVLFNHREFIEIRRVYKEMYGQYPVDILEEYRKQFPERESRWCLMDSEELRRMSPEELKAAFDLHRAIDLPREEKVIMALTEAVAEKVWRIDEIEQEAEECEIDLEQLRERIREFRELLYEKKRYVPMETVLLLYRDNIGEKRYGIIKENFCTVLEKYPLLVVMIDRVYFQDRDIARVVLKRPYAMERLTNYQNDDEMVRYALQHNGKAIWYVNERYRQDREWVRFAIEHSQEGVILSDDCMKQYRSDREMAYLACKAQGMNFKYVDETFRDDYELAYIALSENSKRSQNIALSIFSALSDRLKDDLSLALIDAAGQYPDVDAYSERLKDNDEVAKTLIKAHGRDFWKLSSLSDRIKEKYGLHFK